MAKETIIRAIIDFFGDCPLLIENKDNINADNLPENSGAFSIETVPCNQTVKAYIDGSAKKQYLFVFASRQYFGDNEINLENSELYENIVDWIEEQNKKGNLPKLPAPLGAQQLKVVSNGYVIDNDETKARYQIQCQLLYYKP